ncbi:MAG TPA: hypothetical protein PKE06_06380 [Flavilitoribacter sp.]|mgnify:CR=1 FL=1|nr:hypothetical protein [Flavilitoribacter sp.]HMQ87673.1 hypothetical protein [Flavilitoribacter sp.]
MKENADPPVVFLAFAQSSSQPHLELLKRESSLLRDLFLPLEDQGKIRMLREESTDHSDLVRLMTQFKDRIVIFHYGGHANGQHLLFEDGKGFVGGMAELLALQKGLKLVFLNGCSTHHQAAHYLKAGIPAVLTTTRQISDIDAVFFSEQFYHALTKHYLLSDAFRIASAALKLKSDRYQHGSEEISICRGFDLAEGAPWQDDAPWRLYVNETHQSLLDWRLTAPETGSNNRTSADPGELERYLQWMQAEYNQISLPAIKEGQDLPKIPLDEVFVALKVSGKSTNRELELSHKQLVRAFNKILEELDFDPSESEKQAIYEQILQKNAQLKVWDSKRLNALRVQTQAVANNDKDAPPISLAEAFQNERDMVILGDPGSGKSTLLRWLAVRLAQALQVQLKTGEAQAVMAPGHQVDVRLKDDLQMLNLGPARLPVLVRISEYARYYEDQKKQFPTHARGIIDYLGFHLPSLPILNREALNNAFRQYLAANQAVVMLDGLDEVINARSEILREVTSFIDHWVHGSDFMRHTPAFWPEEDKPYLTGGNQLIVTSRIVGYQAAPLSGNLTHVTIQPMEEAAVRHFCSVWVSQLYIRQGHQPTGGEVIREISQLQEAIFDPERPRIRELAANPLLITILALIFRSQNGKLPESRAELYQRAFRILVDKWKGHIAITPQEFTTMLAPLAAHMHESPSEDIRESDLIYFLERELTRVRKGNPALDIPIEIQMEVRQFVLRLKEDVGLLAERGEKLYHFLHRTFQEYLAGISLIANKAKASGAIIERIDDPVWREPILLALGAADLEWSSIQLEELIQSLLFADDPLLDLLPRSSLFIAHAIPEMEHLSEGLVTDILKQLLRAYSDLHGIAKYQNIRQQLSLAFAKLKEGKRSGVLNRFFTRILENPGSPDEWSGLLSLIRDQGWWQAEWTAAVVRHIDEDRAAWDWPANHLLRDYFSEHPQFEAPPGLLVRNKLLQNPEWHEFVRKDPAWIRLLTALYGGWKNQPERVTVYRKNLEDKWRNLTGRSLAADTSSEGTRLDAVRNEMVAAILEETNDFDARYIYRDSPFSRPLLRAIAQKEPARSLESYFLDQWNASGSPPVQALALLALTCIGYNVAALVYQSQLQDADKDAVDRYLRHLERLKEMLFYPVMDVYYRFTKNLESPKSTNWSRIPVERRPEIFRMLLNTFSQMGLPNVSYGYIDWNKRPWHEEQEDTATELAAFIEAEYFSSLMSLWSDDPFYTLHVVLDTLGKKLQQNYPLILRSLLALPHSPQLSGRYRFQWRMPEYFFEPDERSPLLHALQIVDGLPKRFDVLREWYVIALWPLIEQSDELKPYALSLLYSSTYQDRVRLAAPDIFQPGAGGLRNIAALIDAVTDPHSRLAAAGKMFRQTYSLPFLSRYLNAYNELKAPEAIFLATFDLIDLLTKCSTDIFTTPEGRTNVHILMEDGAMEEIKGNAESAILHIESPQNRLRAWCYFSDMQMDEEKAADCVFKAMDMLPELESDSRRAEALEFILRRYGPVAGRYGRWPAINAAFSAEWQLNKGLGKNYLNWYSFDELAADQSGPEKFRPIPDWWALTGLVKAAQELSYRFAERDEIGELWRELMTPGGKVSAASQLIKKGRNGLKLDALAFRAVTRLAEDRETAILHNLLPLLEQPAAAVLPLITPWSSHSWPGLRQLSALLQAETGQLTAENIDLLIDCLKSDSDRLRFRAMIAIHGANPSGGQSNRTLSASNMNMAFFERLEQLRSSNYNSDPAVDQVLGWMNHNLVHDSEAILEKSVQLLNSPKEADQKIGKSTINTMEKLTDAVWQRLIFHLENTEFEQKKSAYPLLRVLGRQCYLLPLALFPDPRKVRNFLPESYLDLLESDLSKKLTISDVEEVLTEMTRPDKPVGSEMTSTAHALLEKRLKIDFSGAYAQGDEAFFKAMEAAGAGKYVPTSEIYRDGKTLADKIVELPGQTELLVRWTLEELDNELIDFDSSPAFGGYLAIILAHVATLRPETFLSLVDRNHFRDLMTETIELHPFWMARQGAIVMLASTGELDEKALKSLGKALRDVSFTRKQAQQCFVYFQSFINPLMLDLLFSNLEKGPGLVMQISALILSEVARNEKTTANLRQEIIRRMADYLRLTKDHPLKNRSVYTWEDGASTPAFLTSLDNVLYNELIKIVGLS